MRKISRILLKYDLQRQIQFDILVDAVRKAAYGGHLSVLKLLLETFSGQPSPDPEGKSVLHMSAYSATLECLQYLENHGFELGAVDKHKRTALHHAAAGPSEWSRASLEYLIGRGLDTCQADVDGWTPLLWAAKKGTAANIQTLLDAGADSFYQGDKEWIPFAIATYHENSVASAMLIPCDRPLPDIFQTLLPKLSLRHFNFYCDGCDLVSRRILGCLSDE